MTNHRQERKQRKQLGNGIGSALSSLGSTLGSIASNPSFQKGLATVAKTGLEVGAPIAGQLIANKVLPQNQAQAVSQAITQAVTNPQETYEQAKDLVKQRYKDGIISKDEAVSAIVALKKQYGNGASAVDRIRKLALKNYKKGNYTGGSKYSIRPVPLRRPAMMSPQMEGSGLPLALIAAGAVPVLGALAAGLLQPVMEKVARDKIVPKM